MIPFDTLTELVCIGTEPWGLHPWYLVAPPTPQSIKKIQQELGITIPDDYVRLAAGCTSYGGWLAGIGDDYHHSCHILRLNTVFHTREDAPPLPQHLVMLNHGHDGDCDCWDTREITASGEHPIVYIDLESETPQPAGKKFDAFRAYIEHFALYHARRAPGKARRRKAKRMIEEMGMSIPTHDNQA